jgi:glycosyltransferase involved in cell wall biosynthesis
VTGTVLFVWRRSPPPFLIGGAEVSQRLLAEQFAAVGWQTVYLGSYEAPWNGESELAQMRAFLHRHGIESDEHADPPAMRYRWHGIACEAVAQQRLENALERQLAALNPDLVITSQEGSARLAETAHRRAPVAGWLHSVSATGLEVLRARPRHALATSAFVLDKTEGYPGAVLFYPPFVPHTPPQDGRAAGDLLMVNPVPAKGGDLVRQLARLLPERRLTLVEGWWDTAEQFAGLPNVTYLRRTHAIDDLYARHRLLLVPSTVPDAFPRVIIEAGLAGVPTLGALRGGIPEAVGAGGLLLPPGDPAAWAQAIRSLNPGRLARLGHDARLRAIPLVRHCLPELAAAGIIPG